MSIEPAGSRLKKIRLEKGLSLEDIQKKTKINLNILRAIEGDSVSGLSPIYLKGFLKIYCNCLNLDPADFIADYKEAHKEKTPEVKDAKIGGTQPAYVKETLAKEEEGFFKPEVTKLGLGGVFNKLKPFLVLIIIFAIVFVTLFNLGKFVASRRRLARTGKKTISTLPKQAGASLKERRAKGKVPLTTQDQRVAGIRSEKAQRVNPSVITLVIKVRENCWLSLKADGQVMFQSVLEKGRSESWQAKEKIELSVGNAGAVELQVNGQLFYNIGRRGQRLNNILITKAGLSIPR